MKSEGRERQADVRDRAPEPIVPTSGIGRRPPALRSSPDGFTLVELLVVIAIIAILAGLILAATAKAKNSGSKATDINNLRQIMIALHSYTGDNADILPLANWDNGNTLADDKPHRGWLYLPDTDPASTNHFRIETGSLWESLRNPKIYFCPMDKPYDSRASKYFNGDVIFRQQQISTYAMNGAVNGLNYFWIHPDRPYTKLGGMLPTDCAFWETDETDPHNYNDGANHPGEGVSPRHYQGGIQAAFDASVSYVRLDAWYAEAKATNKNRLWCYPNSADGGDPESPGHGD